MGKVVYNTRFGGFGLSGEAKNLYESLSGKKLDIFGEPDKRHDPFLVQVVEQLGSAAAGPYASLDIRELPSGSKYRIDEYDGSEDVMTPEDYEWETVP